jgi:molybdenum cofactor synthesis domain-containing protein
MTQTFEDLRISMYSGRNLPAQSLIIAAPKAGGESFYGSLPLLGSASDYPVGTMLSRDGRALFTVVGKLRLPSSGPTMRGLVLESLRDVELPGGNLDLSAKREGIALAWIVLSDKGARGEREDECGPLIEQIVRKSLDVCHAQGFVVPDEPTGLRGLVTGLALNDGFDLILTSGGTGVAPRDSTPEATMKLIDKRLEGFERAMTATGLAKTPHGAISRAVAGTIGGSLIVNLPGSPKAVRENLEAVLPAFAHAIEKLQGDPSDCASV